MISDDPERIYYEETKEIFGDDILISIILSDEDIFTARNLTAIKDITDDLFDIDGITRVVSLTTVKKLKGDEGFLDTDQLIFDIPEDAVQLALGRGCANQAFRYGDCAYGLQFHLEVDAALIERWLAIPAHVAEIEACDGRICPDEIRRGTVLHAARLAEISDQTFANFIALIGDLRRRGRGPHY